MRFDSLIFDIDGTLWDSTYAVAASFSEASAEFPYGKKTFTREKIMGEQGLPLKTIFADLYPEIDELIKEDPKAAEEMMDAINTVSTRYEYDYLREHGGRVFDGVKETLEYLSSKLPLFIVSNCEKGYIEIMTETSGIQQYFKDWFCYGDTNAEKDVTIGRIVEKHGLKAPVYIGDIRNDALSSKKAGVPFIWAAYGFGNVTEDLYCEKIDDFRELKELID